MPAIKRDAMPRTDKFNSIAQRTMEANETNDCVVKCFALATGKDYAEALLIAAEYGRKPRQGMYRHQWLKMFKDYRIRLVALKPAHFVSQYPKAHQILKSVTTHHPDRFKSVWEDGNNYILHCNRHVAFVENGVNHDWTRGRAMRAHTIYRVEKE